MARLVEKARKSRLKIDRVAKRATVAKKTRNEKCQIEQKS